MGQPAPPVSGDTRQITDLLLQLRDGGTETTDRLFSLVYEELRRIAHRQLQLERPGHTLGTTGLVHETYVRMVDQTRVEWRDRAQFFGAAAWAMRRILVDYARRNRAARRGGGAPRLTFDDDVPAAERSELVLALDEALERLAGFDSAAEPSGGMSLLRRTHRGGNRRCARGDPPDGPAGLAQGAGLAPPGNERLRPVVPIGGRR